MGTFIGVASAKSIPWNMERSKEAGVGQVKFSFFQPKPKAQIRFDPTKAERGFTIHFEIGSNSGLRFSLSPDVLIITLFWFKLAIWFQFSVYSVLAIGGRFHNFVKDTKQMDAYVAYSLRKFAEENGKTLEELEPIDERSKAIYDRLRALGVFSTDRKSDPSDNFH